MEYSEMMKICNQYDICSKCPYQIVNMDEDGKYIYKCKLRNGE